MVTISLVTGPPSSRCVMVPSLPCGSPHWQGSRQFRMAAQRTLCGMRAILCP